MFARPGVVSAHMYGHAVDVAAVAGTSIAGHQQPGGVTEDAVRSILLLPSELQPRQVISLLGLGGPLFVPAPRPRGSHPYRLLAAPASSVRTAASSASACS